MKKNWFANKAKSNWKNGKSSSDPRGMRSVEKFTIEQTGHEEIGLSISFNLFNEPQVKDLVTKYRKCFNWDNKTHVFARTTLESIQELLITHCKKIHSDIVIEVTPEFIKQLSEMFPVDLLFRDQATTFRMKPQKLMISYKNDFANFIGKGVSNLIPPALAAKMYGFQKEGVTFGLQNFGRILIADEMGVGKTVQALALACCYMPEWPVLILAPATLKFTWVQEIMKWLGPGMANVVKREDIQVLKGGKDLIYKNARIVIISYDTGGKLGDVLENMNFKIAILDEAHYLKNPEAQRSKALIPVITKCKRVIILTGTPAFARPRELFNLCSMIRPDVFTNFKEYGDRYCGPKWCPYTKKIEYNGSACKRELNFFLKSKIMIRRLKEDVQTELPPKTRVKIDIELDAKTKNFVNKSMEEIEAVIGKNGLEKCFTSQFQQQYLSNHQSGDGNLGMPDAGLDCIGEKDGKKGKIFKTLMQCYTKTGIGKIEGATKFLNEFMENDIKFLIFAHHLEVLDHMESWIKNKAKKDYIRIDGSVPVHKRQDLVNHFQENEEVRIALLSLTSAAQGITLTKASTVVFLEMHWTPAIMFQAEDRCHRMGQKNNVTAYYLHAEQSLDRRLWENIERKHGNISMILDGKTTDLNMNTMDDYLEKEYQTNEQSPPKKNPRSESTKKNSDLSSEKKNFSEDTFDSSGDKKDNFSDRVYHKIVQKTELANQKDVREFEIDAALEHEIDQALQHGIDQALQVSKADQKGTAGVKFGTGKIENFFTPRKVQKKVAEVEGVDGFGEEDIGNPYLKFKRGTAGGKCGRESQESGGEQLTTKVDSADFAKRFGKNKKIKTNDM